MKEGKQANFLARFILEKIDLSGAAPAVTVAELPPRL